MSKKIEDEGTKRSLRESYQIALLIINYKIRRMVELIDCFSILRPPRPDFYEEDIELFSIGSHLVDENNQPVDYKIAAFTNIPPHVARKYRWIKSYEEYRLIATLIFCDKYPSHPFSQSYNKSSLGKKYTSEQIKAIGSGELKINIVDEKQTKA